MTEPCPHGRSRVTCLDCAGEALAKMNAAAGKPRAPDRRRGDTETILVPEYEIDRRIERAKDALRRELIDTLDRQALERAIDDAKGASDDAHNAAQEARDANKASRRRFAFALSIMAALAIALGMMIAFARENRARLEHLERMIEGSLR